MKAILLTKNIDDLSLEYSSKLFAGRQRNFIQPLDGLKSLHTALIADQNLHQDYKDYVDTLVKLYHRSNYIINRVKPKNFQKLHNKFFAGYIVDLKKKITINGEKKQFYKLITAAMRYDAVRDKDFLFYAKKMGIRSCVYCNANYALSLDMKNNQIGKYELDHFRPQSEYPYLCTNFFNLYPVCASCNKAKSDTATLFCLYTEDPKKLLPFSFALDKQSIVKYMLSQDFEDLKINFNAPDHADHNKIFKIEATYSALKDVVEELVWKHKVYNPTYLKSLGNAFSKKFNYSGFSRFILGNYEHSSEIHKRPLTKLTQDIAKQLGILK